MASIKVKFRASSVEGKEGTVYYQIIHERRVRQLNTDYHVFPEEWNEKRGMVVRMPDGGVCGKSPGQEGRREAVAVISERIRWDRERLESIVARLDKSGMIYTADDVVEEYRRYAREYTLFIYMDLQVKLLRQHGKRRTSETYRAALNSFRTFRDHEDVMLDEVNSKLMEAYEAWHRRRGNTPNTISFYMRILRAVYNRAVEDEIIVSKTPFRHVYTGVEKTRKRAIPLTLIGKIRKLDLSPDLKLDFARDMFLMSFYLRGMSFIDMAFLKKSDLSCGHLVYRRRKTGQLLTIAWTGEMQMILDKYPPNPTQYLLPIIRRQGVSEWNSYRYMGYLINRSLKKVAQRAGIMLPLTMYVARHSWASAARQKGVPMSVISEGMGHDSEATTQIYLSSLDTSEIDYANSLILAAI